MVSALGHIPACDRMFFILRDELNEENSLLLTEKAGLRKILKDFENGFIALNGR